jgi:L-alanine-DL-glutamate epimerase-like enolase superfamily enzyme
MNGLDTRFERVELPLENPFIISRGTTDITENVIVEIDDGDHTGIGGAAPSERYDETSASVEAALVDLLAAVEEAGDPHALARIDRRMREIAPEDAAARSAVSIALHDLVAKRFDTPLYRYLGLDPTAAPATSLTVAIDDPEAMAGTARSMVNEGYPILKVKVGADRPIERVTAVREAAPDATIRVDANEAWGPDEAIDVIDELAALGVEFVEQPVSADDDGRSRVGERATLPVAADESCLIATDVPDVAGWADICVVKLTKTGGIREAIRTVQAAHAHGLAVMLGCMVASNASLAAACHLAPLTEYADLDGSLLLADDPFAGVSMPDGRITLEATDRPGTGAYRD